MNEEQKAAEEILEILNAFNMLEFKMDLIITGNYVKESDVLRKSFAYSILGGGRIDFETKTRTVSEIMKINKVSGSVNVLQKCSEMRNKIAHGVHLWRGKEMFTVGRKKKIEDFGKITKKARDTITKSNSILDRIIDKLNLPITKGDFSCHV